MYSSRFVTRRVLAVCTVVSCMLPSVAQAISAAELLPVQQTSVVTRGDFIRAAVKALQFDTNATNTDLSQYVRVAKGLQPYIAVAHERGALRMFGKDLLLSRGITRGEAVQLVVKLGDFDPVNSKTDFTDVRRGTAIEGAVGIALQEDWIQPLRSNLFGVSRALAPKDALRFIAALMGEESPYMQEQNEVKTIAVELRTQPATSNFPKGAILQTLWQLIEKTYLYQDKIDQEDLAYAMAEAMMKSLDDPYSVFMRPTVSQNFQTQIQGEVTGIGAQVEYTDDILTIVTPLRGSPAEAAGLKPGDKIVEVDGESIVGIGFGEAVSRVRGPKGSSVKLVIDRDGVRLEKTVRRDVITVPEIDISWQGEVAIVRLLQFGSLTDTQLRAEMTKVQGKNPRGIVLDLRNNPGGLLHAASNVLSNFVPKGSAVAQVKAIEENRTDKTEHDPTIDMSVPVIVLINGGSASASEIVAGALQDLDRATIVGEPSFGKGTVQQVLQFNDQSAVKMTIAEWLTPNGRKIDSIGVQPDIVVQTDERDAQMSKALELLRIQR